MAGTVIGTLERIGVRQGSPQNIKVVLTCTADASDAKYPDTVVNTLPGISAWDLRGLKLYSVKAFPGAAAPTDGTDLTITDEYGVDLLGGKGTSMINAISKAWIPVGPNGYALPALITGNITISITGNSVNEAIITIILEFVGD